MTINGFFRQVAAAQRRAERNEERRQRAQARVLKLQAKLEELELAAEQAAEYQEKISQLNDVHRSVGEIVDWQEIAEKPMPLQPAKMSRWSEVAIRERDSFKASFFQRLFGSEAKLREKLEQAVTEAIKRDEVSHQAALKLHKHQVEERNESTEFARAILAGDLSVYGQAITELEPLSEMQEMGCAIDLTFVNASLVEVTLNVQSDEVVPREAKTLTKAGKLSVKQIPESKFNELYQDYVCGCVLRTARELFATLPLKLVVVNATTRMLNSSTGHVDNLTILSVAIPRATLEEINFSGVDPSEAMKLFLHRMGFKRSLGFAAVQPFVRTEYPIWAE